jgi:branched-chain amino acid transport system ATP-binding protein
MNAIDIIAVSKTFRGVHAVNAASFSIAPGELVALIGPNGSGKTTLLNILSGFYPPSSGRILLDGMPIAGFAPDRIVRAGIVRMFQHARLFAQLSAFDNLLVIGRSLGLSHRDSARRAIEVLRELGLESLRGQLATSLSGGQRKLLEFGMCFMTNPRIALLDEPFSAIHPTMKETMATFIRRRHSDGQTILLVSHDMPVVADLCLRTVCMNAGKVLVDGKTPDVLNHPDVIEAYLGGALE